jgi:hypothetical protein
VAVLRARGARLVDALGEGLDLLPVVHVHQLPPAVVERDRHLPRTTPSATAPAHALHAVHLCYTRFTPRFTPLHLCYTTLLYTLYTTLYTSVSTH